VRKSRGRALGAPAPPPEREDHREHRRHHDLHVPRGTAAYVNSSLPDDRGPRRLGRVDPPVGNRRSLRVRGTHAHRYFPHELGDGRAPRRHHRHPAPQDQVVPARLDPRLGHQLEGDGPPATLLLGSTCPDTATTLPDASRSPAVIAAGEPLLAKPPTLSVTFSRSDPAFTSSTLNSGFTTSTSSLPSSLLSTGTNGANTSRRLSYGSRNSHSSTTLP